MVPMVINQNIFDVNSKNTIFFYQQHFYKQHEAQIGLFWNGNIRKKWDLDYDTISKWLYSFQTASLTPFCQVG